MPRPRTYATAAERQAAYRRRMQEAKTSGPAPLCVPAPGIISSVPGHRRWKGLLLYATGLTATVVREMEGYFEDRSEAWQDGQQGESFTEILDSVQEMLAALEDGPYQDKLTLPVS